jgi:hypothetical protein
MAPSFFHFWAVPQYYAGCGWKLSLNRAARKSKLLKRCIYLAEDAERAARHGFSEQGGILCYVFCATT